MANWEYLSRADEAGLDLSGAETFIDSNLNGITLGGWFYFDRDSTEEGLIGKWDTNGNTQGSYRLYKKSDDTICFEISSDGSTGAGATGSQTTTATVETGKWYFIVGRLEKRAGDNRYTVFIGQDTGIENEAGTDTSIAVYNGTAAFEIAKNDGNLMNGRVGDCFLCAMALSDALVEAVFEMTRGRFGVGETIG